MLKTVQNTVGKEVLLAKMHHILLEMRLKAQNDSDDYSFLH